MSYQQLVYYDWAKGLGGSGEIDFGAYAPWAGYGHTVAESYQIKEPGLWVFQIRKGMHYALDPNNEASKLMNGRELTADDVVWNIWRLHIDPRFPNSGPRFSIPKVVKDLEVEKTGPWEVTLKTPGDPFVAFFWVHSGGCSQMMYAKEVIEKYGHADDWRRVVGTGPYIWTDYVQQSVATFTRNPNYWEKNPIGPGKGDQLPYAQTVKQFIVPDLSTRLATMRTGKGDWVAEIQGEDARGLLKTNPQLKSSKFLRGAMYIRMKSNVADLPFKDVRVRQALMLATDFNAIKRDLYGGDAEIFVFPISPAFKNLYVPPEDLPESVRNLYKYNPEKAKQLLAEAGYPNGFKTKIDVWNAGEIMDVVAAYKAMWAKVGIDLQLQPKEYSIIRSIQTTRAFPEMLLGDSRIGNSFLQIYSFSGLTQEVPGYVWFDDTVGKAFDEIQQNVFINFSKADERYRKLVPYVMERAPSIPIPDVYSYTLWQPWIKNHYGERSFDWWTKFAWVDQDLKEKMTGRR